MNPLELQNDTKAIDYWIVKYAEYEERVFIGKTYNENMGGNILFFLDTSACPFTCGDIQYMTSPYDGEVHFLFRDKPLDRVPANILDKFKQEFKKFYGFDWRSDMSDEELVKLLRKQGVA